MCSTSSAISTASRHCRGNRSTRQKPQRSIISGARIFSIDTSISNYPLCVPHRAIFMSGLYPTQSHVQGNEDSLKPAMVGLGGAFQKAGYHTGYIGKWHLYNEENQFVPKGPLRFGFEDWHA